MATTLKAVKEKFDSYIRKAPKPQALQHMIENCNPKHLIMLCTNLETANGPSYLQLALEGCNNWKNTEKCLESKTLLMQRALENLMKEFSETTEETNGLKVVDIMLTQLDNANDLTAKNLALLVECCIRELEQPKNALNPCWLVILSKLISMGSEFSNMVESSEDAGNIIEGKVWRKTLLRKLCIDNWKEENATNIVKMLSDISDLETDEIDMIVEKACTLLSKNNNTSNDNCPSLLFHVLQLTRGCIQSVGFGSANTSPVFGRITQTLSKHFNRNHKKIIDDADRDTMESADLIDHGISSDDYQRSECMVIFHLIHAIRMGHPIGKEVMKLLKSSTHLPEVVIANPFNMFLGLAMTSIKQYHLSVADSIKSAISKHVQLDLKRDESAWFRQTVPSIIQPKALFTQLINQSTTFGGWDLIGDGLISVAIGLLDSSCNLLVFKPKVSKVIGNLGHDLVKLVIKKRSTSIVMVLSELTKRILSSKGAIQYTDCLRMTIKDGITVIMEEPPVFMNELLDHFGSLGINGARRVLVALMPLVKYGRNSLRNSTILILRKLLFSPNVDTRRIAVVGVLQLLKYFRISSSLQITQMLMSQSSSCLSQAVINVHQGGTTNNESLCLELMGVLKRGLSQQAGVRMSLYRGLHEVVGRNPELCVGVLDMLYSHAIELNITSEDAINPIDIDAMITTKGNDVYTVEPIGWFLHCVQLMVGKANHLYGDINTTPEEVDTASLVKLTELLNRLRRLYADNLDTMDLNFEKGADYSKSTTTGRYNILRVEAYKNIYEALMDYTIMHGAGVQSEMAGFLVRLQYRHSEMNELLNKKSVGQDKTVNKGKVNKEKKKKIENKDTQADNSQLSQNKSENGTQSTLTCTIPHHAMSLKAISNILHSILNDNKPSNHEAVSQLRSNVKLGSYFLRVTLEKETQLDKTLSVSGDDDANDVVLKHLSSISSSLAEHCIFSPEADEKLLAQTLECFLKSIKLVRDHFHWNDAAVESFYLQIWNNAKAKSKGSKVNPSKIMSEMIEEIIIKLSKYLESEFDESDDVEIDKEKIVENLLLLLAFICKEVEIDDAKDDGVVKKAYNKITNILESLEISKPVIIKQILELFYICHLRIKSSDTSLVKPLAQEIHSKVGDVDEVEVENLEKFKFITPENGEIIFHRTANYLEYSMESADCIISRCKQIAMNRDSGIASTEGIEGYV